jgi:hypothetical protein
VLRGSVRGYSEVDYTSESRILCLLYPKKRKKEEEKERTESREIPRHLIKNGKKLRPFPIPPLSPSILYFPLPEYKNIQSRDR